jgi:predicted alpha-1,6-mannanase (GH76 family)
MLAKYAQAIEIMRELPDYDQHSWHYWWYTHWVKRATRTALRIRWVSLLSRQKVKHDSGGDQGSWQRVAACGGWE